MSRSIENTNVLKLMIIAALSALFLFTSCGGGGGAALPDPEVPDLEEEAPADEPEAEDEEPEEPGEEPEEPGEEPEPEPEDPDDDGPVVEIDPEVLEHLYDIDLSLGENAIDEWFYGNKHGAVTKGENILGKYIEIPANGYVQYNFAGIDATWHIKEVELMGFGQLRMGFYNPDTFNYDYGDLIDLDADQVQMIEVEGQHTEGEYAWMRLKAAPGSTAAIYSIRVYVEPKIIFEIPEIEPELPEFEWGV